MDVISILNTIRANNSAVYQERIPEATEQNMREVGNAILAYQACTNEFLDALVNRIVTAPRHTSQEASSSRLWRQDPQH